LGSWKQGNFLVGRSYDAASPQQVLGWVLSLRA